MGAPDGTYDCSTALADAGRYLASALAPADERRMRDHLDACDDCRDQYRASVATTARIGREHREQRAVIAQAERKLAVRRLALSMGVDSTSRFHRMRTLLYPAFFAFLMVMVFKDWRSPGAEILGLAGEVAAGDERGIVAGARARLAPGEWCATTPGSEARLSVGDATILLAGEVQLGLERARPARVRLASGRIVVAGEVHVTTELGVVELESGEAEIELSADGLALRVTGGSATYTGPEGGRSLARDDVLRVARR